MLIDGVVLIYNHDGDDDEDRGWGSDHHMCACKPPSQLQVYNSPVLWPQRMIQLKWGFCCSSKCINLIRWTEMKRVQAVRNAETLRM